MSARIAEHPAAHVRAEVLTTALLEVGERLAMSPTELGGVIGVSQASMSRMKSRSYLLKEGSKEWELAALVVRMYRALIGVVCADDAARLWFNHRVGGLGGQVPREAVRRIEGLLHVCEYLDAHRARV